MTQTEFPLEESDPSLITPPYALKRDVYKLRLIREVSDETAKNNGNDSGRVHNLHPGRVTRG